MFTPFVRYFYPDICPNEVKKFSLLSLTLSLIISAYWILRLCKVTIFYSIGFTGNTGRMLEPTAKTCSVFILFFGVLIYSKLIDHYKKEVVFNIVCGFYTFIFLGITATLFTYELFGRELLGEVYMNLFGWVSYFSIESFGSIATALFWSYAASITRTNAAKRGYPCIIASAQCGAVLGSILSICGPHLMRNMMWPLLLIATLCILLVAIIINHLAKMMVSKQHSETDKDVMPTSTKPHFLHNLFKGIILIVTRPYIFGIFIVSTFYEVISIIIEYQMKSQAHILYGNTPTKMLRFFGLFGTVTNGLAFIIALCGTSYLLKRYGLRFCLLIYPLALGCSITALYIYYTHATPSTHTLLWSTFAVMVCAKALSYAINNPTKEMMYIPTSKDAQFKAKGFIDVFGKRSAKLAGSQINHMFKHNLAALMTYGSLMGFGLISVWLLAAFCVGIKNAQLIHNNKIVD